MESMFTTTTIDAMSNEFLSKKSFLDSMFMSLVCYNTINNLEYESRDCNSTLFSFQKDVWDTLERKISKLGKKAVGNCFKLKKSKSMKSKKDYVNDIMSAITKTQMQGGPFQNLKEEQDSCKDELMSCSDKNKAIINELVQENKRVTADANEISLNESETELRALDDTKTNSDASREPRGVIKLKFASFKTQKFETKQLGEGYYPTKINFRADCIRKRIKCLLHNYILSIINKTIAEGNCSNSFVVKIPKDVVNNIKVDSNRNMLCQSIKDVYTTIGQFDSNRVEHNRKVINSIQDPTFKKVIEMTVKDYFIQYRKSEVYQKDISNLIEKEGTSYVTYFKYYVDNFLNYFGVYDQPII